jgi:hypothetical protein
VTVVTTLVCFTFFAREAAGALGTRHSLRPLFSWAKRFMHDSGASRREIAESYLKLTWLFESLNRWQLIGHERATLTAVIVRESGRSSIPKTAVTESKGRGVLDTPLARGMTTVRGSSDEAIQTCSGTVRWHQSPFAPVGASGDTLRFRLRGARHPKPKA